MKRMMKRMKDLVLLVLHHLPVGGLLGKQLPSSALHNAPHGAEAGADPGGQVEVLPLVVTAIINFRKSINGC